ncbi:hypothetical protein CBR_g5578 [Chara braunii]|uniref:Uncharacterized protein n=1 Tax=Chara braunii TaxID=69332 RepID=A0A388JRH8_CHABU|nr:hypothetical protein CBR_g5578 [Chara braunii]|eukprot:GBG60401.1 hypothetical protein CBR_g5578 [Chara braunii]
MSSRSGGHGKKRDSCVGDVLALEKSGGHAAKKRKAVVGGPSIRGGLREDVWVRDPTTFDDDDEFKEKATVGAARKLSKRAEGGVRINDGGRQGIQQPRGGGFRGGNDGVIDVDVVAVPAEVVVKAGA